VIQANSIDLIFSNWLLMYLSDEEVEQLVQRMVKWLKVGGSIFFRESCFHQSGDSKRKVNPTHYREPRFYTKVFKECHAFDQDGNSFELSLVTYKCIGAYVKNKKNQNQVLICPCTFTRVYHGQVRSVMDVTLCFRYAGCGKKSSLRKIGDFKNFWTMCSTKLVEYCAMSAFLEKVM